MLILFCGLGVNRATAKRNTKEMSRHSKNNTAGSVFTYHEKQLMGLTAGTKKVRLTGDSLQQVFPRFFVFLFVFSFSFSFPCFFLFLFFFFSLGLVEFASPLSLGQLRVKKGICFAKNAFTNSSLSKKDNKNNKWPNFWSTRRRKNEKKETVIKRRWRVFILFVVSLFFSLLLSLFLSFFFFSFFLSFFLSFSHNAPIIDIKKQFEKTNNGLLPVEKSSSSSSSKPIPDGFAAITTPEGEVVYASDAQVCFLLSHRENHLGSSPPCLFFPLPFSHHHLFREKSWKRG